MVQDRGLELGQKLRRCFSRGDAKAFYAPLASTDSSAELELSPTVEENKSSGKPTCNGPGKQKQGRRRYTQRLPFRRIFTRNVSFTLVANFLLAFHVGTFNSLWFVFLSTPMYDPTRTAASPNALLRNLPFIFTGGLGLQPREVGMAMAILGVIGIGLQLGLYPRLSARLVPYLSLVPSSSPPPSPKDGIAVWMAIAGVLALQVVGRTFALPTQTILVNNCTPHPSVLGTVHGIGQSVSSFARTLGPMLCGFLYGLGLNMGVVGAVWWGLSGMAILGFLASLFVWEGDGHEIWLEGDDEDGI
ncbi:hypothetical protein SMACR_06274 [Sordaria macrospora]|uniref:Uncharacterized protein n=1 Tax=Sordaria macrospora TaxID=5147 RepID=A0A8S9A3M1_SORMA|nr:hypothetical protein SMACR_06274 [Sordaria macrospora]WPJ67116.1 hypothetical protein SMAC4_06274 [Sordaria macrospora]